MDTAKLQGAPELGADDFTIVWFSSGMDQVVFVMQRQESIFNIFCHIEM